MLNGLNQLNQLNQLDVTKGVPGGVVVAPVLTMADVPLTSNGVNLTLGA